MSFITTAILWFLPLISIPLIFHLLKRRRFESIPFSTLRFFNSIEKESINKINIINILLLIIRTLIILFIILMLSRPVINGKYSNRLDNNSSLVMFCIDNSFSNKNYIDTQINNSINNIVSSYNDKTFIKIVRMSDNKIIYNKINDSKVSIQKRIPTSYAPLSLNDSFQNNILDDDQNIYSRKDLYIFSDLTHGFVNNNAADFIKELSDWNVFFIKNSNNKQNLYIESIEIDKTLLLPNELFSINCTIINNYKDIDELTVELYVDNTNVGKNIISSINPSKIDLEFKSSLPDFGKYQCYIKVLSDDIIKEDNFYYFNINVKDNLQVASISTNNNDFFLKKAFLTFNDYYKNHQLNNYSYDEYLYNSKNRYNSVVLFGFDMLDEAIFNKIKSQSNNIIIFPLDDNHTNQYLSEKVENIFLSKNNFTNLENNNFVSINTKNIKNDFFSNLFNISKNEQPIKIFKYIELPISPESIIQQSNGTTFLYKYKIDNVTLNILSSPLDLLSYNFPLKGSFLPFIKHLTDINALKNFYYANDMILLNNNNVLNHVFPNENSRPINVDKLFLNEIGLHKITLQDSLLNYISINIHPDEFNVLSIPSTELKTIIPNAEILENTDSIQSFLQNMVIGYEIWLFLLYILIILVFVEMYLSNFYYKT